jgi:hypothetical protein
VRAFPFWALTSLTNAFSWFFATLVFPRTKDPVVFQFSADVFQPCQ